MMNFLKSICAVLLVLVIGPGCQAKQSGGCVSLKSAIFLVRHAEKVLDQPNPSLTEAGQARARRLSEELSGVNLSHIFSTDYRRTLQTAEPTSEAAGVSVTLYDPSDLSAFAQQLKAMPGVHLVVGHSNTTPQLVEFLGGEPGTPIYEPTEYDRLYKVEVCSDGSVRSLLTRFGEPYVAER